MKFTEPSLSMQGLTVGLAALCCAASTAGVTLMKRWASQRLLDIPDHRSSHVLPTPRGGGAPLSIVVLIAVAVLGTSGIIAPISGLWCTLAGAMVIAAIGWLDDLYTLSWRVRIVVQGVAAALLIACVGPLALHSVHGLHRLDYLAFEVVVTLLWIIGLTNAYNFMDGIDGIAGSQAIVVALAWMAMAWRPGQMGLALTAVCVAGATAGFLFHNWAPATIFMGDVGSGFLGYLFAAFPVISSQSDGRFVPAGALVVWPFIFDTSFTFLRRLRRGEHVFSAHRSHLYQRLIITGLTHQTVALLYAALAALGGFAGVSFLHGWRIAAAVLTSAIILSAAGLYALVIFRESRVSGRVPQS